MNQRIERKGGPDNNLIVSLLIGACLLIALWLAYSWGASLLKNSTISRQIGNFQTENDRIAKQNEQLSAELKYLNSPQYRDKWAKEHDGLAQPGEKVLLIEFLEIEEGGLDNDSGIIKREILLSRPHREQWKIYFFGES